MYELTSTTLAEHVINWLSMVQVHKLCRWSNLEHPHMTALTAWLIPSSYMYCWSMSLSTLKQRLYTCLYLTKEESGSYQNSKEHDTGFESTWGTFGLWQNTDWLDFGKHGWYFGIARGQCSSIEGAYWASLLWVCRCQQTTVWMIHVDMFNKYPSWGKSTHWKSQGNCTPSRQAWF